MAAIRAWTKRHPYQTAFHIFNGFVMFEPAIVTYPVLYSLGFEKSGPSRESRSSEMMRWIGPVKKGSLYATTQSAAMGGYGAGLLANAVRACAGLSSATVAYRAYKIGKRRVGPKL